MSPLVRKPQEKYKLPTKYWLLILSAICVVLMLFTFVFDIPLKPLNEVVSVTVVPLQKGISKVGESLYSKKQMVKKMNELVDENNRNHLERLKLQREQHRGGRRLGQHIEIPLGLKTRFPISKGGGHLVVPLFLKIQRHQHLLAGRTYRN